MASVAAKPSEFGNARSGRPAFGSATVRVEAEVAYRLNDVDKITVSGLGTGSAGDAEVSVLSGMANLAVDILTWSIVKPYVLVGIGVANVTLESDDLDVDDDDTVFAYQAGAGLGFAVTETTRWWPG